MAYLKRNYKYLNGTKIPYSYRVHFSLPAGKYHITLRGITDKKIANQLKVNYKLHKIVYFQSKRVKIYSEQPLSILPQNSLGHSELRYQLLFQIAFLDNQEPLMLITLLL